MFFSKSSNLGVKIASKKVYGNYISKVTEVSIDGIDLFFTLGYQYQIERENTGGGQIQSGIQDRYRYRTDTKWDNL